VGHLAGQRMAHAHLPWRAASGRHPQIAPAVDRAAAVADEPRDEQVGGPSLGRAAQVEFEAGRATNHADAVLDLDRAPLGGRARTSRAAGRRGTQRPQQRYRLDLRPGPGIAGAAQGAQQGRVDEPASQGRRPQRGRDRGPHERRRRDTLARIGVQAREIAAGVKARQPPLDLGEHRGRIESVVHVAHDARHGAHRGKAVIEHARSPAGAVSRPPWPRPVAARPAQPCRRRRPAAGPLSGRGSTGWSQAVAVAVAVAGAAPSGGGEAARRLRRPPPRRPERGAPAGSSGQATAWRPARAACDSEASLRTITEGGKLRIGQRN
jgi:hypothetical protein